MHLSSNRHRPSRRILIVLLTLVLLVSALSPAIPARAEPIFPAPVAQNGGDGRFSTTECSAFKVPAAWQEGRDVECGYLTVPEEHGSPSNATIQLGVVIVRSTNPNPPDDPIVMLQGGPGGSTIDLYTQLIPLQGQRLRANRDMILFDQRGTLHSKPSLVCPEYLDMVIEVLDVKLTPEESDQKVQQALSACRARLENEGVNLSAFDSIENAADIESLRQALGYEKINLYGVSYGTLLAQHYMRQYPQNLRSVILDSTVPLQINFILDAPRSENRSFEALFSACEKDPDCNSAYPNLRQIFFSEVDRLNKNPVHIQLNDPFGDTSKNYQALIDGDTLLSSVFQMMYNTDIIPFVPKTIYDARAGNYDFLARILSILVFDRTMSLGMYYSVMCSEDADINPQDYNLEGLPSQIVQLEKDSIESFLETCQMWDVEALGPQVDQPVSSDIPTLVLSGAFDPITPPNYGQTAAQTLSNSHFFQFPNGGHGAAMNGECPDQVMVAFLNNPNQAPESGCVSNLGGPEFITPGSVVSLPVLVQLLNLQGGTGPQLLLYMLALLFLLTALLVYPIVWLVRLFRSKPQPAVANTAFDPTQPPAGYPATAAPAAAPATALAPRPAMYRLAPWISSLTGLVLLVFTAVVTGIIINMAISNDTRVLIGLPASARPLFAMPLFAALLALLMLVAAIAAWSRRSGTVWGRIYFTLLTLSAAACIAILAIWGMLTAVFG